MQWLAVIAIVTFADVLFVSLCKISKDREIKELKKEGNLHE